EALVNASLRDAEVRSVSRLRIEHGERRDESLGLTPDDGSNTPSVRTPGGRRDDERRLVDGAQHALLPAVEIEDDEVGLLLLGKAPKEDALLPVGGKRHTRVDVEGALARVAPQGGDLHQPPVARGVAPPLEIEEVVAVGREGEPL